tara:strand:+ start:374 stop:757 length:384 start_codon:yes stop_codon:yes gene_type:complete
MRSTYANTDSKIHLLSVTEYIRETIPVPVVTTSEPVFVKIRLAAVEVALWVIVICWAVVLYRIAIFPSAPSRIPETLKAPLGPVILAKDFFGNPTLLFAPFERVIAPIGSWIKSEIILSTCNPALES